MAEITAKLVQELREKTSAGMMDCKKALVENNGDIEAAADWLRQKGIVKAASKAGRVAASGLVTVVKCDDMGCVVELNAETDFVAKNDKFQTLVANVANKAAELGGDFDATLAAVKDDIAATIAFDYIAFARHLPVQLVNSCTCCRTKLFLELIIQI